MGRELWRFYRHYVKTAVHTASAAALAIFGLLVFIDPLFALLAIASYVLPPVVLFVVGGSSSVDSINEDAGTSPERTSEVAPGPGHADVELGGEDNVTSTGLRIGETDVDSEHGGTDTDSQSADGDTDSDSGGGDTDSDSDEGDTDSDSDT